MNPLKWYRNWRIRRTEERIAYLEGYCDYFHDSNGKVPYIISITHSLPEKRAKVAELRKKIYHLQEF
jgi:hypothetical protein